MNTPTTPRTHRTDRAGRVTLRSVATTLLLACACLAGGCVPIPYKPTAAVSHEPVAGNAAETIALRPGGSNDTRPDSIAKAIHKDEPRVMIVDATQYLEGVLPGGYGTLAELLDASRNGAAAPFEVDYVLCIGEAEEKKLHQTGDIGAVPPFVVGYTKMQWRAILPASMVDVRNPQAADGLLATTTYTEVIAGFAYGFATIGRPQAALEEALAADVAHRLTAEHPRGAIRLAVVAQRGGAGPAGLPSP